MKAYLVHACSFRKNGGMEISSSAGIVTSSSKVGAEKDFRQEIMGHFGLEYGWQVKVTSEDITETIIKIAPTFAGTP